MIILLLVAIVLLLVLLYILHSRDIMYPSIVLCAVYIVCICFAMYNWDTWDMWDFSLQTASMIFSSVLVFAIVGIVVDKIVFRNKKIIKGKSIHSKYSLSEIKVNQIFLITNFFICLLTVFWHMMEVRRIAGTNESLSKMLAIYRAKSSYGVLADKDKLPFILRQLEKYVRVQGNVIAFILVNNVIVRKIKIKDILLVIPVFMMCSLILLSSGRLNILFLLATIIVEAYILWHRKNGWNRNISGNFLRIGIFLFVIILVLFYLSAEFIGRNMTFDPVYYITLYVGGSIKLFDLYIKKPIPSNDVWGKETFYSINQFLAKFGNGHKEYIRHTEFRFIRGLKLGNVYGAPRRYIQDFGIVWMLILVALFSLFFSLLYCNIKYSKQRHADFSLLFYCYLFGSIPMFPIDDVFYSNHISTSNLVNLFIMYILYYIFVRIHIRSLRYVRITA